MKFKTAKQYISFSPLWMGREEEREVVDTMRSGWITTGPRAKEFERRIAQYCSAAFAVATFSCTDAMLIALKVLGVKDGDEVITTPFTFASTAHVICHHRAKPVFVDVEPDTFNIDIQKIKSKITSKTKVILPVHFGGHPCDMHPILSLARQRKLFVMEDAAHAIGSSYKGKKIGSLGDITCFSFYATKNITTAEGGMAVTDNVNWAKRMRIMTMYGIADAREIWHKRYTKAGSTHYEVVDLGYKCNMTDICAALGIQQLRKLNKFNKIRETFAKVYNNALGEHSAVQIPQIKAYAKTNRHFYPLLLNLDALKVNRDAFIDELKKLNIGASALKPLHLHSYYMKTFGYRYGDFPIAEEIFKKIILLPISPKIGIRSVRKVAESVLYLLDKYKR